ncbi:hypothetical protein P9265_22275 [Schinkia azotoformans]|uniref:hypothetical protein n=1 Tax=Schinkia azotoformans TaxID=1454 RepID=UPI002E1CFE14|nr:hypothetical protein [Schinkia azotoformans]
MKKVKPDKIAFLMGILSWSILLITLIYWGILLINAQMMDSLGSHGNIILILMLFDTLAIISSFIAIFIAIIGMKKSERKKRLIVSLIINIFYICTALILLKVVINGIYISLMGV